MYNIHLLPASFGDSILIEYGQPNMPLYILVDGGPYFNFPEMVKALKRVAPKLKTIELLVITHIDIDHIDGIITLLNQDHLPFSIKEVWFNGFHELEEVKDDTMGALQGEYMSMLLKKGNIAQNTSCFEGGPVVVSDFSKLPEAHFGGFKVTLLSPGISPLQKLKLKWDKDVQGLVDELSIRKRWEQETRYDYEADDDLLGKSTIQRLQEATPIGDTSVANRSSIAFIGEFEEKRCLFAGDATSDNLLEALPALLDGDSKQLKLDAWKLAHHGSKGSTLDKLMEKINCKKMLISTDGKRYKHPDPECIAKLIKFNSPEVSFYFNYLTPRNKQWDNRAWKEKYHFKSFYPLNEDGISVALSE